MPKQNLICETCNSSYQRYLSPSYPKSRYCSWSCKQIGYRGSKCPLFKGVSSDGRYLKERLETGQVQAQHRLVVEKHLGRLLRSDECVHHIDNDPHNNRIENLMIMTFAEHASYHAPDRKKKGWAFRFEKCQECGTIETAHKAKGFCENCYARRKWKRNRRRAAAQVIQL